MKLIIGLLTILSTTCCIGQSDKNFIINEYINNDSIPIRDKADFKVDQDSIYEDNEYLVSKTCSGEWGGTIKFKNKKSGIEYSAASTCPVVVNKINGKYYVTNTLAHLSGFSEILEINAPDSMAIFKMPKPRKKKGKTIIRYVGDDESKSTEGTKQLIDSIGVQVLASFPYNEQLYHIVTDFQKTYLAVIDEKKFVTIETVSNESIWTYGPEVFTTDDNHLLVFFENEDAKGYLEIFDNQITVIRKK